jgi:hypothetical protein
MEARGCAGPRKQTKTLQDPTKLDLGSDSNDDDDDDDDNNKISL